MQGVGPVHHFICDNDVRAYATLPEKRGLRMATTYKMTLTNSRGLARAIFFSGLAKPMVID